MSPEQVRAENLDARTDLFSFGLVLYEMATGRQAFEGGTTTMVREAILNRAPMPVRELNPIVPLKLEGNEASIFRLRLADRKLEKLASLKNVQPLGNWFSLDPDDSPMIVRNTGTDEIYALDWEAP
jgi:serine/threonine protein kinase